MDQILFKQTSSGSGMFLVMTYLSFHVNVHLK
jgi:hypothetical protein